VVKVGLAKENDDFGYEILMYKEGHAIHFTLLETTKSMSMSQGPLCSPCIPSRQDRSSWTAR
jgi:hypothetical protein